MRLLNIFLIVFLLAVQTQCYIKRVGVNYALTGYKSRQSLRTVAISLPTASTIPSQPQQQQQSINLERSLSSTPILERLTIRVKNKVLNAWGCFFGAVVYSVTAFLLPFIAITAIYCDLIGENKRRKAVDRWINVWSWLCLRLSGGEVFLYGAQNLPTDPNEPVIYVPNHTSFLDIFALSGSISRPFKYFSKSTILKIPLVGWGMQLAQHIFLDRHNPQSAIDSVSQCITKIKDGNSIVVFAEGTRSLDGRLGSFKNGAFRIADKTGARIVPVSIGNLFKYMPPGSIGPLSRIKNSYVMIHPPIDPKNKSVKELKALCYEAINSGLPPYQQSNFSSLESKE